MPSIPDRTCQAAPAPEAAEAEVRPDGAERSTTVAVADASSHAPVVQDHAGPKARLPEGAAQRAVVVVPAFNEERAIGATIGGLQTIRSRLQGNGLALLIYVVNDGSTDATASLADQAGADRVLRHGRNMGLGCAVRTGLRAARDDGADIVIKFDADLQHDVDDIPSLLQPLLNDEADIVYGARFDRIEYRMPLVRRAGNAAFTGLMRWLTGWPLRDSQPGIFAINRSYLAQFNLPGDYNYTQQILLDAYHKGMRFTHVPVRFRKRDSGRSFVSLRYPLKVLLQILMVLCSVKPLKVFVPIGLAFLALGGTVFVVELAQYLFAEAEKPVRSVNLVLGTTLFGMQTLFFGMLAQLIVQVRR